MRKSLIFAAWLFLAGNCLATLNVRNVTVADVDAVLSLLSLNEPSLKSENLLGAVQNPRFVKRLVEHEGQVFAAIFGSVYDNPQAHQSTWKINLWLWMRNDERGMEALKLLLDEAGRRFKGSTLSLWVEQPSLRLKRLLERCGVVATSTVTSASKVPVNSVSLGLVKKRSVEIRDNNGLGKIRMQELPGSLVFYVPRSVRRALPNLSGGEKLIDDLLEVLPPGYWVNFPQRSEASSIFYFFSNHDGKVESNEISGKALVYEAPWERESLPIRTVTQSRPVGWKALHNASRTQWDVKMDCYQRLHRLGQEAEEVGPTVWTIRIPHKSSP